MHNFSFYVMKLTFHAYWIDHTFSFLFFILACCHLEASVTMMGLYSLTVKSSRGATIHANDKGGDYLQLSCPALGGPHFNRKNSNQTVLRGICCFSIAITQAFSKRLPFQLVYYLLLIVRFIRWPLMLQYLQWEYGWGKAYEEFKTMIDDFQIDKQIKAHRWESFGLLGFQ